MTIRVRAAPPDRHGWIAERAGLVPHPGFMALEAVDEQERTLGMVGFDLCWGNAVALHVAVEHPAALRHLLRPGFGAAFEAPPRGFGKAVAVAAVLSTNKRSLRLVQHLGFRHVHTGQDYVGPGTHMEFFEMRREHCRFIPRAERRAA